MKGWDPCLVLGKSLLLLPSEVGDSWFDLRHSETDDTWQLSSAK